MSDHDKIIEVMALASCAHVSDFPPCRVACGICKGHMEAVLVVLEGSDMAVVPVEPTEAMLAAGMAEAGTDLASEYRAMLAEASKETER